MSSPDSDKSTIVKCPIKYSRVWKIPGLGGRAGDLSRLDAGLAAQLGQLLVLAAVLGAHDQRAVGQARLVLALDGDGALQHSDVCHGLVLHVLVSCAADVCAAI